MAHELTENPWKQIGNEAPFVHPADKPFVDLHNDLLRAEEERVRKLLDQAPDHEKARLTKKLAAASRMNDEHQFRLEVPPSPFIGSFEAKVVVLLSNPGWDKDDEELQGTGRFAERAIGALCSDDGGDFWPLDPQSEIKWWTDRTRQIALEIGDGDARGGFRALQEQLMVVELHGYHSKKWYAPLAPLPTQAFNIELVRHAMARKALIIMPRSIRHWYAALPALGESDALMSYERRIEGLNSPRSAYFTRGNLGDDNYAEVIKALGN